LVESFHPIPMANFLVKSPLDGDIMPLSFGDGGVFMLYSPQRKVWMDARLELHPQERLMELYRIRVKIKRGEIDDPAQAPLPPSVRFIVARANSLDMIEGLSHSRRFRPLYVDEAGVCFARLRQRGETVTWTPSPDDAPTVASDSASLPANLRAWDKPFDPAHAQLIADAPAPVWYRNNPPALHEQVGMIFEAMGYPALAEKYLKASVALGEHHNDMARDLLKRRSRSSGP
jgi:hypothetical protein